MEWAVPTLLSSALMFLGLGMLGLWGGAEFLVRGSRRLALAFGIKPLVIGMTIVAAGTSAPELVAALFSAIPKAAQGGAELALGTVLGSNIANVALIIGITALVRPLIVKRRVVRRELLATVLVTILFFAMAMLGDGIGLTDGLILVGLWLAGVWFFIRTGRTDEDARRTAAELTELRTRPNAPQKNYPVNITFVVLGLIGLGFGGMLLIESSLFIAENVLHLPKLVVGLMVVAVGTSLPELATSLVAQLRRETDISVGNVLGSNIINIVMVIGITGIVLGLVQPLGPAIDGGRQAELMSLHENEAIIVCPADFLPLAGDTVAAPEKDAAELLPTTAPRIVSAKAIYSDDTIVRWEVTLDNAESLSTGPLVVYRPIAGINANEEQLTWSFPVMLAFLLVFVVFLWLNNSKRFHTAEELAQAGRDTSDRKLKQTRVHRGKTEKGFHTVTNEISRMEGALLLILYVCYMATLLFWQGHPPWSAAPVLPW